MKYEKRELKSLIQVDKIVTIHYFELSKDFFYPPETHNFWELHYVDKGTAISVNQDKIIELNSGEVYFHKPNDKHQLRSNGIIPPNVCVISFVSQSKSLDTIENKKLKLSQEQKSIISRFLSEANANFDISHSSPETNKLTLRKNRPLGGDQMLKIYIEEFLLSLVRELSIKKQTVNSILQIDEYNDSLINSIIAYFRENITKNLTLAEICNNFHFSKSYICK
mgnify:CR=1 FL=1